MDTVSENLIEKTSAFQLKGSLFALTSLQLLTTNLDLLRVQLQAQIQRSSSFFKNSPIIIELQKVSTVTSPLDFQALIRLLKEFDLIPVGVRGGNELQMVHALSAGLAQLANKKSPAKEAISAAGRKLLDTTTKSKLITQPVRSGQQIYAKGSDLIVLAAVSAGAELLAEGNIHVYGPLRGRALAGVGGDETARIFCRSLAAELVSIAGHYWVSDDLKVPLDRGEWVQVYLEEKRLRLGSL
ncbi:MAG: septum site-determining protein MinC [Gammaproteobacteria bacterium]|nr:septum site-determining protein MinC [Gammaproteobacteria bacterium]